MTGPLDGATLIVTRPAGQAGRFIERATDAGARCIPFPTLEIERLALDASITAVLRDHEWDWAIFTSANAVDSALAQLPFPLARRHAAVGQATARALETAGVGVDARPGSANSEGLLALPAFANVADARVLLVKGSGGRDLLPMALRQRGAVVQVLEVYRRNLARPSDAALMALQAAVAEPATVTVVATSAEVLQGLLQLVPVADRPKVLGARVLVPGARVAAAARRMGWQGPILEARTAEDPAMIDALVGCPPGGKSTP